MNYIEAMLSVVLLGLVSSVSVPPKIDLSCTIDPDKANIKVKCVLDLPVSTVKGERLKFGLGDQMAAPTVQIDQGSGMSAVANRRESQNGHIVIYSVPASSRAKSLRVEISYASMTPKGPVYLLSSKECFCGGYNTLWFPALNEPGRAVGKLQFTTPSAFVVKASGKEISSVVEGSSRKTSFFIKDPTVPTFAAAPFHVVRFPGKVPVSMYLLNPRPNAGEFAQGIAQVLGVLQREFGSYPYPDFSVIETPSPESSSLGFTGASFEGFMFGDSNSIDGGFNLAYFGHEMSHQWWGNLVATKGKHGSFVLSEGLAQYGSLQAVTQLGGVAAAKTYRTVGYPGYSRWQCLRGALAIRDSLLDVPLFEDPETPSLVNHQLANSKGFLALETVAQFIGHDTFRAGLKEILREHAWDSVSWEEFWQTLESVPHQNLGGLRRQWFEGKGIPTVWTEWTQRDSKVDVILHQKRPLFTLKMPLVLTFLDGTTDTRWVKFDQADMKWSTRLRKGVLKVELDPEHLTLHSTPQWDEIALAYHPYAQVEFLNWMTGNHKDDASILRDALSHLPKVDPYGGEFLARYSLSGVLLTQGKRAEAKEQCTLALQCPVRDRELLPWVYLRLARVAKAEKDLSLAEQYLAKMRGAETTLDFPSGAIRAAEREVLGIQP